MSLWITPKIGRAKWDHPTWCALLMVFSKVDIYYQQIDLCHSRWSGVDVWLALWTSVCNVKPYLLVLAAGLVYAPFTVNTILGLIPVASQQTFLILYSWCTQCYFSSVAITDMWRLEMECSKHCNMDWGIRQLTNVTDAVTLSCI